MIRITSLIIVAILLLWQGYLIYISQQLVSSIETMDTDSPFSFFASASIPFYVAFFIATCVLAAGVASKAGANNLLRLSSVAICMFATGFMQLHIFYASYSPIFEAASK